MTWLLLWAVAYFWYLRAICGRFAYLWFCITLVGLVCFTRSFVWAMFVCSSFMEFVVWSLHPLFYFCPIIFCNLSCHFHFVACNNLIVVFFLRYFRSYFGSALHFLHPVLDNTSVYWLYIFAWETYLHKQIYIYIYIHHLHYKLIIFIIYIISV